MGVFPRFLGSGHASKIVTELPGALRVFNVANIQTGKVPSIPPNRSSNNNLKAKYIVKSGDTLSSIAAKFSTTWQRICDVNGIPYSRANLIKVGQNLDIPIG
ncbi:LysM peptidoglycan-binding domain-containing protein [Acinetobacter wuhouensis]|nr:LysM peptidoglycan-binding domain-containing protein [Acinetobacter wuhouensis]